MPITPVICWFRRDLRLADNVALTAAAQSGKPVICLYILDDETPREWRMGGASRWWLHQSLTALNAGLGRLGGELTLRRGEAGSIIRALIEETGADTVFWNRLYNPAEMARDKAIKADLRKRGLTVDSFPGNLGFEPWTRQTGSGGPYRVYSPFMKSCLAADPPPAPIPAPARLTRPGDVPSSDRLDTWSLLPSHPDWAGGLRDTWVPGEAGALARFGYFIDEGLDGYSAGRNYPDKPNVSRLSPHLHFGEISVRQIWQKLDFLDNQGTLSTGKFRAEVIWREFSHHLLFHYPDLPTRNWRKQFDDFPWQEDNGALTAWQNGMTGYPLVDAGMRELWHTGYMHNRVRMVVASFLVKHLMLHWRHGADWFWDTLVDADLANNAASWQWVAGSGADAAPYFRIFNPVKQGQDYDPNSRYIRRWVPELAGLSDRDLHEPWKASDAALESAGIAMGETYPDRIVDHAGARTRALAAYQQIRQG
jgi:deoxyribodipyrimidine photo-lyase